MSTLVVVKLTPKWHLNLPTALHKQTELSKILTYQAAMAYAFWYSLSSKLSKTLTASCLSFQSQSVEFYREAEMREPERILG